MPRDPFIREKFTRERSAARKVAEEYFERFPKDRYLTEIETWRLPQAENIEFTMKRLRDPLEPDPLVMTCPQCANCGWVCENHPDRPWEGEEACNCGGAGMPCTKCNMTDDDSAPQAPKGFRAVFDKNGSRH
jgi:hypothetical protein